MKSILSYLYKQLQQFIKDEPWSMYPNPNLNYALLNKWQRAGLSMKDVERVFVFINTNIPRLTDKQTDKITRTNNGKNRPSNKIQ